jgi:FKBP-type peptidyl-prolyl cis-trans isomerase
MKLFWCVSVSICVLFFYGCGNKNEYNTPTPVKKDAVSEPLIHANKKLSENEKREIDAYIQRKGWPMKETGSGLRYSVYREGRGPQVNSGDLVTVLFEITLLNGTVCYTSEDSGEEQFMVDHDHVESGLHEAIKYLKVGDKAKIIIPSHLAFGLTGDSDKIPPLSPIVYDLEVLDTQPLKP